MVASARASKPRWLPPSGGLGVVIQHAIAEEEPVEIRHQVAVEGIVGQGQHGIQQLELPAAIDLVVGDALVEYGHVAGVRQHDFPAVRVQRPEPVGFQVFQEPLPDGQPLPAEAVGDVGVGVYPAHHHHQGVAGVHAHVQPVDGGRRVVAGLGIVKQPVGDQRHDGQVQVFHVGGGKQLVAEQQQRIGLRL